MEKDNSHSKSSTDSTLLTSTPTMRRKAEFARKCCLYILKCLRFAKLTKSSKDRTNKGNKNTSDVSTA